MVSEEWHRDGSGAGKDPHPWLVCLALLLQVPSFLSRDLETEVGTQTPEVSRGDSTLSPLGEH